MLEAARAAADRKFTAGREPGPPRPGSTGEVLVQNATGEAVERFNVLGVDGPVFTPDASQDWANPLCLVGRVPTEDHRNFIIVQEPLAAGAIGRGVASGVIAVRVTVEEAANEQDLGWADMVAENSSALAVAATGQAAVLFREGGTGEQWAIVCIGNSRGVLLGIITPPSENGAATSSYTVDLYGSTIESLSGDALTEGVGVIQDPPDHPYFHGEIVGVRRVGDELHVQKFLDLPVAYTASEEQVCLRLWQVDRESEPELYPEVSQDAQALDQWVYPPAPTNFLVDLSECLPFLDAGSHETEGFVVFNFGGYGGMGSIGKFLSVPVVHEEGWNLCQPVRITADWVIARDHLLRGTANRIETSTESFGTLASSEAYPTTLAPEPNAVGLIRTHEKAVGFGPPYTFFDDAEQEKRDAFYLTASVRGLLNGFTDADLFEDLPDIPTIGGAVSSDAVLLAAFEARVRLSSHWTLGSLYGVSKLDPRTMLFRTIGPFGQLAGGRYELGEPSTQIEPWIDVYGAGAAVVVGGESPEVAGS